MLGGQLGDILHVDVKNKGFAWGKRLKVRILISVSKPLIKGCWLNIAGGSRIWVSFKFEKLIDLYFVCNCLDYMEVDCVKAIALQLSGKEIKRDFEHGVSADGLQAHVSRQSLSLSSPILPSPPQGFDNMSVSKPHHEVSQSSSSFKGSGLRGVIPKVRVLLDEVGFLKEDVGVREQVLLEDSVGSMEKILSDLNDEGLG